MDSSYLEQQVSTIIGQLHTLFDEIGVPHRERETRESELFAALSETLQNQVRLVAAEKTDLTEEAKRIIATIKQMEASLDDNKAHHEYEAEDEDLRITLPLTQCLQGLKEKHLQVARLHRERFEQVKKLVQALESYSSHLEPSFIKIELPPTSPNSSISPSFDLSSIYVNALDDEFTRVYEEYTRRVATVKALAENIIQLWAELGTPQAQTDASIVKHYRDSPEQLGLHEDDINRIRAKRDKLAHEKKSREKRLEELRITVEVLWDKLGIEEPERRRFLNSNRGCGVRQINEFEDELSRMNELKRQNLHLFVEDARYKLQDLWDGLYFSEEEMLEFTPAFSDVYSDALLEAHEQEIARLEALKQQRAPTLALIEEHRSLIKDRDDLQASSQDASRLLGRGQKGEKRDPTRLLREEKMRKRIAKDLPKIAVKLRKVLEEWEEEYGRPFLVHGQIYLDELDASETKAAPGPRSKTPAGPPLPAPRSKTPAGPPSSSLKRSQSANPSSARPLSNMGPPPSRSKTPVAGGTIRRNAPGSSSVRSPTKLPERAPLANLINSHNSPPERQQLRPSSRQVEPSSFRGSVRGDVGSFRSTIREEDTFRASVRGKMGPPQRAPPPLMRDLFIPPVETPLPRNVRADSIASTGSVRAVSPEDVYDDRPGFSKRPQSQYDLKSSSISSPKRPQSYYDLKSSVRPNDRLVKSVNYPPGPASRQISNTSSATTTISGSENWETYGSDTDPEPDTYSEDVRGSQSKRHSPADGYALPPGNHLKKQLKGMPAYLAHPSYADSNGDRIPSGSEANWTDEEAF